METQIKDYTEVVQKIIEGHFDNRFIDITLSHLNIDNIKLYFKSIEIAESTENTSSVFIARNMLGSNTKITVKIMNEVMKDLDTVWDRITNFAFLLTLEKEKKINPDRDLDGYIKTCTFDILLINTIRLILIFMDEIVKSSENANIKAKDFEAKLERATISVNEILAHWKMIEEETNTDEFKSYMSHGKGERLSISIARLLEPIDFILDNNKVIEKIMSDYSDSNDYYINLGLKIDNLIATIKDFNKNILVYKQWR